ncbi:MAG: sulfotransferase [Azospirillaceae bacterium]|nr:sulfotransferase [Azospirillaceae bacterium]
MPQNLHVISGLPRSGSTLLAALLCQNPRFHAAMTSPVAMLCGTLHAKTVGGEFGVFFDDARRARLLRSVFDAYYEHVPAGNTVFDTNRTWTGRAALLGALYPDSRVICCVRDVGWIIDSIERLLGKNPLQLSRVFNFQPGTSVYARVETLMNSDTGLVGLAWSTLREAWFGDQAHRLIIVPYDHLVKEPARTMARLYEALGQAPFTHDFENVVYDEPDYDSLLGMPGLHKVRERVEYRERRTCLPPDLFAKYGSANFWTKPELNPNGVLVL